MKQFRKMISILLMSVIISSMFVGCGSQKSSSTSDTAEDTTQTQDEKKGSETNDLKKVRVAVIPQQLGLPFYYISEKGWDVENGFKLELSTFQSGAPINEALGADLWDLATIGAAGVLSLSVYDAVQLMAHEDSSAGIEFMVRADSDIAKVKGYNPEYPEIYGSPETVKGKTFLFPIGSGHHLLLGEYLKALGLNETDIKLVNMDHAEGYQAFVSGQGDFSATAYPTTDIYRKEGYVSAMGLTTVKSPYFDNVIANRKFYDNPENHDVMVEVIKQVLRAADEFKDEEILLDAMLQWYKVNGQEMNKEDIRNQVLERPFLTATDYKGSDTTASLKRQAEFFLSINKITEEDLEKVFNNIKTEILTEALEEYEAEYGQK